MTFADRFWSKVDIPLLFDAFPDDDACWMWIGGTSLSGRRRTRYGILREGPAGSKRWRANRLACLTYYMDDLVLLREVDAQHVDEEASHQCDRSLCVNPRHLRWESHADNVTNQSRRKAA